MGVNAAISQAAHEVNSARKGIQTSADGKKRKETLFFSINYNALASALYVLKVVRDVCRIAILIRSILERSAFLQC